MVDVRKSVLKPKKFSGEGIKEEQIENYDQYKKILESFCCPICLDIVKNPLECTKCETLYCEECWEFIKMAGKKCTMNCEKASVKKANKFVLDTLSKLKITCESCQKKNIDYNMYIIHYEVCSHLQNLIGEGEIDRQIALKNIDINALDKEIANLDKNGLGKDNINSVSNDFSKLLKMNKYEIQKKLLTYNLPAPEKLKMYETAISGNLSLFSDLISDKHYPIFEEVSAAGYLWTSLHYAMHYGKEDIIFYILDYCKTNNVLDLALNLESKDERCPVLCLLKSNYINLEAKTEIFKKLVSKYKDLKLSDGAIRELRGRNMMGLLKK